MRHFFVLAVTMSMIGLSAYAQPNPGGVAGASLWLKANAGASSSGSNLTGWVDQTGNNTFSVTGTPGYKTNALNFNQAATFNNTDPKGSLPSNRLNGNTNITYVDGFAVFKHTDPNSNFLGATAAGGAYGKAIFASAGANTSWVGDGEFFAYSSFTSTGLTNNFSLVNFDVSLSTAPFATGSYNGAGQILTNGTGADFANLSFTPMIGGTNNQGTSSANGWDHAKAEVAEIVLYPSSLSSADKLKIESYLAVKYGISLGSNTVAQAYTSSNGTTIWAANATYKHDIFGIGKDDGSALDQPQSNSVNTGSGDGTGQSGRGNIVLSNPSSLDNNDFLIIGHDNAALTEAAAGVGLPPSLATFRRLNRTWLARQTGDVGTVSLTFNLSGLTITGTTANSFRLVVDADGDGNLATGQPQLYIADSYTGNIVSFSNVALPDNRAFALVTVAPSSGSGSENLWLEANTGVTVSGNNVTGWADQSGINVFTVSGTPTRIPDAVNFNPAISFNNTNAPNVLPTNRLSGNTQITVQTAAVVMRSNTNTSTVVGSTATGFQHGAALFGYNGSEIQRFRRSSNNATRRKEFPNPQRSSYTIALVDLGGSQGVYYLSDGTESTMTLTGNNFTNIAMTPLVGGTRSTSATASAPFNGEVAEIITFPNGFASDLSRRPRVISYLALKYGISAKPTVNFTRFESSNGTVIWDNTTYWNDVFGIGKDDAIGLDQRESNSMNTGSGDGTGQSGKGNIIISTPDKMDNNDFLMIGHDNAPLTETAGDLPSNLPDARRLQREWKVKRTNDVGKVSIVFNRGGLTLSGTSVFDYRLLIDVDGNGNFTDGPIRERLASNILGGDEVFFTLVDLPDGAVFTILTKSEVRVGPGVLGANLWLKGNDGATSSGTTLTGWEDKTLRNTFAVTGAPGYKTNAINFNPAITFNNTNAVADLPTNRLSGNFNISYVDGFAVYKHTGNNSNFLGSVDAKADYGVGIFASFGANTSFVSDGVGGCYTEFVSPGLTNTFNLVNWDVARTSSPFASGRINRVLPTSVSTPGACDYSDIFFTPMIGGTNNNGAIPSQGWPHAVGEVAEIVHYPSALSQSDKLKVESYLAVKYGISLGNNDIAQAYTSSTGATIWAANATYKYDIFGIGKDDGSALNQPQSNSMNTGSGDGTGQSGKGNIVLSSPSSLDNNDFLIVGHDNAALAEQSTNLPPILNIPGYRRLSRTWKAAHTGDVGTITLSFDLNSIPVSGVNTDDFGMIVDLDGDGNFTTGTVERYTAATYTGNIMTINDVDLPNNAVFTFITAAIGSILPADLLSFDVTMNNCEANVAWRTTNESKLRQYEVESTPIDQIKWTSRAVVQPRGNGQSGDFNYSLKLMLDQPGQHQFRLKMTDIDGAVKYSRVVLGGCRAGRAYVISPNPASQLVRITGTTSGEQLRLIDALGRVVLQLAAVEGTTQLSIQQLQTGLYQIQSASTNGWQPVGRLIKQ